MRLVSLKIQDFRCIERAKFELGPGLNVIHGPNDIGKSSLAEAIRAVLLLTHSQKEHENFIPWSAADVAPAVELEFEMNDGFYRVAKSFGHGNRASSLLTYSKDGHDFSNPTRGREVDEKLRKLLRWGVPSPGGSGKRIQGMPETFLTIVLLPDQANVGKVLDASLASDFDHSGKDLLTQALKALASDPLFKSVLGKVQSKVDQAFTQGTGRRRSGKGSPWSQQTERINKARETVERLRSEVTKSADAENKVGILLGQLDAKDARVKASEAQLAVLERRWNQKQERIAIEHDLEAAQAELSQVDELFASVRRTEADLGTCERALLDGQQKLASADSTVKTAEALLKEAEARKLRVEGEAGVQARALERAKLERTLADVETELLSIERDRERAEEAKTDAAALDALQKKVGNAETEIQRLRDELGRAKDEMTIGVDSLAEIGEIASLHRYLEAKKAFDTNEAALTSANTSREIAERLRAEATSIENRLAQKSLPSREILQRLVVLERDLEMANAKLAVGVSLALRPERALTVVTGVDEDAAVKRAITGMHVVEGRRSVRLSIEGVGEIVTAAGRPEHRLEAEALRTRWANEAHPALNAAAVSALTALVELVDAAEEQHRLAKQHRVDAETKARAELDIRSRAQNPALLRRQMGEREIPLRGKDRDRLSRRLAEVGADRLDLEEANLRRKNDEARARVGRLEVQVATAQAAHEGDHESARQQKARLDPRLTVLGNPPDAVLRTIAVRKSELEAQRKATQAKLTLLEQEAETAVQTVGREFAQRQEEREQAVKARDDASAAINGFVSALSAARALLEERRKTAQAADREGHVRRVAGLSEQRDQLPNDPSLTEDAVQSARLDVEREHKQHAAIEADLHAARGALEHVGGNVVREDVEAWEEALDEAEHGQHELETHYEAWRLLLETLMQAESSEEGHLGRAVIDPISARFGELTKGRYGNLELGPNLETNGIVAEGAPRPVSALSVGTREQLATIMRICLAEQLGTCLVLDDQLTQSDPARVAWLRDLLYETSEKLQIVVLTCHPEDYLLPERNPSVVDLSQCLVRYEKKRGADANARA